MKDSVKNLKVEMTSSVNEFKNEDSRFKNEVGNLVSFGIQNNVHVSQLTESGYSYVYNKPYGHVTTSSEMDEIKRSCSRKTNLCLGGRDNTNDVLLVVACGLCDVVFTKTAPNTPNLHNGAYWYYTPGKSIGFAPNSTISNFWGSDGAFTSNNQRVSWDVDFKGGWRLGSLIDLQSDRYYKVIFFSFGIPHGVQHNIQVSQLTQSGYSYVYNKPYNHFTKSSEMDEIKRSCSRKTNLCLGGRDSTNDVILVVSCGLCSVVFTKTARNTPNLHNGAYWYYSPDVENSRSMGFAPNSTIDQYYVDIVDKSNNQRVSWHLSGGVWGGYRLGSLIGLNDNTRYYKVILKRDY